MERRHPNPVVAFIIYTVMMSVLAFTLYHTNGSENPVLYVVSIILMITLTMWILIVIGAEFKSQESLYDHEYMMDKYSEYLENGGQLTFLGWLSSQLKNNDHEKQHDKKAA